ncbi:hypothetical protein HanXRQr2_Chr06g0271561 [Helianthus annuus]|uniref:Ulp1 protease family, C-terminal catalytic domain-containing protein n=1 Tax=Helianthus annuus TaxID=4232 RepID=A0A9K3IV75_HELAN|nr:hypothetical protein HanXRQr2_Chr06g0271561 [Helianthus annuus]KAJ0574463.1 hypothetical protein HanHA89_Chr06g0238431 [Helianthus annuus]KAJ0916477.1 hypothetical protein HanPSC8_Chr06g0262131 [Helianthus annuus]
MPCKVKNYMVGYLKAVEHPSAARMATATLTKKKLEWATSDNFNDCGVLVMRHMEMYIGSDVEFECDFSTRKNIQDMQLQNLRMNIATNSCSDSRLIVVHSGTGGFCMETGYSDAP